MATFFRVVDLWCKTKGLKLLANDVLVKGKIKKTPPVLSLNDVFSEAADSGIVRLTKSCLHLFFCLALPFVKKKHKQTECTTEREHGTRVPAWQARS